MTRAETARLRELFAAVEPIEVTGRINLQGMKPPKIAQLLPWFTDFQRGDDNPAFSFLVDNQSGRIFTLRSGFAPQVVETINGIPFRTGIMPWATAKAAGGVWCQRYKPLGAHVEGQAAAFMRVQGITDATMYINGDGPCKGARGCFVNLSVMLAEGSKLTVYNKNGRQFPTFTGLAD